MCKCVCECVKTTCENHFSPPPPGFWGSNPGYLAWRLVPSPTKPSCLPCLLLLSLTSSGWPEAQAPSSQCHFPHTLFQNRNPLHIFPAMLQMIAITYMAVSLDHELTALATITWRVRLHWWKRSDNTEKNTRAQKSSARCKAASLAELLAAWHEILTTWV